MAKIAFRTKGGKKVAFSTGRKGHSKARTAHQRFVGAELKKLTGGGMEATRAMVEANRRWRAKGSKSPKRGPK
jgi:hypothetical protein